MTDYLVELGRRPAARSIARALRLPIPLPELLRRETGPMTERSWGGVRVVLATATSGALCETARDALTSAGAEIAAPRGEGKVRAVVLDASGLADASSLRALFELARPELARLERSGRFVVLGRAGDHDEPSRSAAQAALEGFVRSLAKELGRAGTTANLVRVAPSAEARLAPVLRFVVSPRSAFVSGQPLVVSDVARAVSSSPRERRLALVTGAARGIGEAIARALAADGAHVICLDRPEESAALDEVARSVAGAALSLDLTAKDAAEVLARHVAAAGGLDILVHNAGITRDKTLARMSESQWDDVLAVNLGAVVTLTRALTPHLRDGGRVVALSSIAGIAGNAGQTAYAASKAGVIGFVRATSRELARRGITVNAVAPGFIETRMTAAIPLAIREVARRLSALGQGGEPEDVADAIAFLAREDASGVTGQTLRVCGGAYVGA